MVLAGHYVNKAWKLQKRVLSFCNVPPPHTGVFIYVVHKHKVKKFWIPILMHWSGGKQILSSTAYCSRWHVIYCPFLLPRWPRSPYLVQEVESLIHIVHHWQQKLLKCYFVELIMYVQIMDLKRNPKPKSHLTKSSFYLNGVMWYVWKWYMLAGKCSITLFLLFYFRLV
ncbi:uncharacterized protein LOC131327212 [Rhododendron vialii]|uniref:uncharacterized protein LOC131327212 n=1 Tax=Rhododendron vialii TaxID=182163 RepID=UPI00265D659C|nr:uncharacterized protein LOC131327212 [Rhododendron vialii]